MSRAVRITPEQYLALLDLGAVVYATDADSPRETTMLARLLGDRDAPHGTAVRKHYANWCRSFWTLVDSEE